ncbi:MAG TPA: hypothetical protein PLY93_12355, partial [Turneriella sp.]|nr:hypothetical protein [Turneriella sp.]
MWNRKLAPLAVAFFLGCNNYGLLEQLQNPGGGNSAQNIMMYAFVSSATMNGNLTGGGSLQSAFPPCSAFTGLQLADCACTQMAQNAGLAIPVNKYVAWLSTSTNDMTCRISNTTSPLINCTLPGGGPTWVNMSGQTVASGYAALL